MVYMNLNEEQIKDMGGIQREAEGSISQEKVLRDVEPDPFANIDASNEIATQINKSEELKKSQSRLKDLFELVEVYKKLNSVEKTANLINDLLMLSKHLFDQGDKENAVIALNKAEELDTLYNQNGNVNEMSNYKIGKIIDQEFLTKKEIEKPNQIASDDNSQNHEVGNI